MEMKRISRHLSRTPSECTGLFRVLLLEPMDRQVARGLYKTVACTKGSQELTELWPMPLWLCQCSCPSIRLSASQFERLRDMYLLASPQWALWIHDILPTVRALSIIKTLVSLRGWQWVRFGPWETLRTRWRYPRDRTASSALPW